MQTGEYVARHARSEICDKYPAGRPTHEQRIMDYFTRVALRPWLLGLLLSVI